MSGICASRPFIGPIFRGRSNYEPNTIVAKGRRAPLCGPPQEAEFPRKRSFQAIAEYGSPPLVTYDTLELSQK